MISSNRYDFKYCYPYLETIIQMFGDVLSNYNKALYKKDIATHELYQLRGRLEDKKLKVITLENDLFLEKNVRFLNENQLDVAFCKVKP